MLLMKYCIGLMIFLAANWLDSLPQGKSRDLAVQSFSVMLARNDPASAISWLDTIQDNNIWQGAAQSLAFQWMQIDPVAAKAWVDQSSLPDNFKKNFANSVAQQNGRSFITIRN